MARKLQDTATFKKVVSSIRKWSRLQRKAQDQVNEANREATVVKNNVTAFMAENKYPLGTRIAVDGKAYFFAVAKHEKIPPEKWYELWQEEEITEKQFFEALSVSKDAAANAIGADQVELILEKTEGKKPGIRKEDLEEKSPYREGVAVFNPNKKSNVRTVRIKSKRKVRMR